QSFTQCYIMNQSFVSTIIILLLCFIFFFFFFQAEDGIRDGHVTGVQTCALPISWTARLNFLRHPQALCPEPRLALNEALRMRQMLPHNVTLHTSLKSGLHLRANHRFVSK